MIHSDMFSLERACGMPVSRETLDRLKLFESLFKHWNARVNLAAASTLDAFWERHILDSAQLVQFTGPSGRWVDLGSGGGLPGLIVAILLDRRWDVHLIESNRKKAAFLTSACVKLGLNIRVHAMRIADAAPRVGVADIISARALASLPSLLDLSEPFCDPARSRGLFHKGRGYRREIEESRVSWQFDLVEHPSVVESDSVILEIAGLTPLR